MVLRKKFRHFYEKFIWLKGEPTSIAYSLAIGVFVGTTPTIPFHTMIIVSMGFMFRQNITAAYIGSWIISNPLTIPLLYLSEYQLGISLLGMAPYDLSFKDYAQGSIATMGWQIFVPLLTGGIIMAPILAVSAFFISRRLIIAGRAKKWS
jgi:uncharacterized protein